MTIAGDSVRDLEQIPWRDRSRRATEVIGLASELAHQAECECRFDRFGHVTCTRCRLVAALADVDGEGRPSDFMSLERLIAERRRSPVFR